MKKMFFSLSATAFFMIASIVTVKAQGDLMDVAMGTQDCSKLVDAIKAADLVNTFKMEGSYTVFAPSNAAFEKIPADQLAKLMKNKAELARTLKYHIVGGNWSSSTLMSAIKQGNGSVQLPAINGSKLTATVEDGKIKLTDENGGSSYIANTDIAASNGVIHMVDNVAQPMKPAVAKRN